MKTHSVVAHSILLAVGLAVWVSGCKEDESTAPATQQPIDFGTANFSRYVAIGNSLTAGFQSNALSGRDQAYSFPALLAEHVGTAFDQPLMLEPGVGNRQRLVSLTGPVLVSEASVFPGNPVPYVNTPPTQPYHNLGVPGAVLADLEFTTDFATQAQPPRSNPFFLLVLRSSALGRNVIAQARALNPTFITLDIGNNDVLGYATSGGLSGTDSTGRLPTEPSRFAFFYSRVLDSLKTGSVQVVAANIPDVTSIPFFTTVGPQIRAGLPPGIYFRYQKSGNTSVAFDSTRFDTPDAPLITLLGSTYAAFLGQPTGKWYRDRGISTLPPGIDTTKPFGFHPQNPWPDALALDAGEQAIAGNAVTAFNASIASLCAARDIPVVDVNGVLKTINQGGLYYQGYGTFSSSFIQGGVFSYDGVHPSSRGYVIFANEFIKVINASFNAHIPLIDIGAAPGIPIGKIGTGYPDYGSLDFMVNLMRGGR